MTDFHGIRMKGDFKTDNIKSKDGISSVEIDDSTGDATFKTDLRIESGSPNNDYALTSDASGNLSFESRSVPINGVFLFESDTAVMGYTILTDVDDAVVFLVKGSDAGGYTGGVTRGAWDLSTYSNHRHSIPSNSGHVHSTTSTSLRIDQMPSHTHYASRTGATGTGNYIRHQYNTGGNHSYSLAGSTPGCQAGKVKNAGSDSSHNHGNTANGGSHVHGFYTGYTSPTNINDWRPTGRNFTRQQRIT